MAFTNVFAERSTSATRNADMSEMKKLVHDAIDFKIEHVLIDTWRDGININQWAYAAANKLNKT